ncbi:hypothetical protein [Pontimicrobium aquaticum]|uniref:Alpha/beta hydrolase family protein n=1 Tax=Pontimicrobium aquaticum TaxID=2565367 RepID=A0A4U0F1W5_9FLAO|nr:hypothetical protein [Pontimicrobium aquaticum]TJY37764.1 hypothetical protein E5167_00490 [Pontimicrobium aquaticum]
MKKLNCIILSMIFFSTVYVFGQQKLETFEYQGEKLSYTILLPINFDATKTYPVMVGPSQAKSVNDESFYWKGTKDSQGWILIGYRIYGAANRTNEIKALFNHLKSTYNVEGNKFYTTCHSANSAGIFDLVMEMPNYFSGIIGMAGNPNNSDKEKMKQLKGVKVLFIVGDQDTYWMSSAKKSYKILQEIGVESSIEIIKNGKHVMKPLIGKGFLDRVERLRN